MNKIQTEYRGHIIAYKEHNDTWECDAFASRQGSSTLALARARIDKLLEPKPDKPKFTPVEVWVSCFKYSNEWSKVALTSQTEDGYWASLKGEREKLGRNDAHRIKAVTPANDAAIAKIGELRKRIDGLKESIGDMEAKLTPFKP